MFVFFSLQFLGLSGDVGIIFLVFAVVGRPKQNFLKKGGVGKTTTSCSIGVQLAKSRNKVLIVSTDPAHNLSDAFCQKIGREPTPIDGFDNLAAMEIDANNDMEEMQRNMAEQGTEDEDGGLSSMMSELTNSIPGIDEAMSFSELMKQVQGLDYDVVVFDTAPTGHTLRLLSFPTILEKALGKVMELKDRFGGLIGQATAMIGQPGATQDAILGRLEETRAVINKVNDAFQDPALTTFVSGLLHNGWYGFMYLIHQSESLTIFKFFHGLSGLRLYP